MAQLGEALAAIEKSGSEAVVMFPVQNVIRNRERIAAWAVKNRLPVISGWAQFAEDGNLMSYGPNLRESSRRLAVYVVNLKAAKALGVTVPRSVLLRADQVIDP